MKCVLLFFLAAVMATYGQRLPVAYNETFDVPEPPRWFLGTGPNSVTKVENGRYVFDWFTDAETVVRTFHHFLDLEADYEIETVLRLESGSERNGYGVVWGSPTIADLFVFSIASDGHCVLWRWKNNVSEVLVPWTKAAGILPIRNDNTIRIESMEGRWRIFVNDSLCVDHQALAPSGFLFGIHNTNTMKLTCDRFTIRQHQPAILRAADPPSPLKKIRLSDNVNSKADETVPIVSSDGQKLYFSRMKHEENTTTDDLGDIWVSMLQSNGQWGRAERMARPLNNTGPNYIISLSNDRTRMLLANTYHPNGENKGGGFSSSTKTATGWTVPQDVVVTDWYNRDNLMEACASPDGTVLLMAIRTDNTRGRRDIFVSFLEEDNTWSRPVNIGNDVNTFGEESYPFMASDGVTMYFSSEGRPGYGGFDIYMTRRLDDSWRSWSEPVNLGPAVNSDKDNFYYYVTADGSYAYVVDSDPKTGLDIYRLDVAAANKPKPVVIVRGTVVHARTGKALQASVEIRPLSGQGEVQRMSSDPSDGSFSLVLPAGVDYGINAVADGFFAVSERIDATTITESATIQQNLALEPIERGRAIVLNNIFFETGTASLEAASMAEITRLATLLKENADIAIAIHGHTDDVGSDANNMTLSSMRAQAVKGALESMGISPSRLSSNGFGETLPVADNTSEQGRQKNRRVEFVIQ
jgi:OmpA-OmpF porin, OOP family